MKVDVNQERMEEQRMETIKAYVYGKSRSLRHHNPPPPTMIKMSLIAETWWLYFTSTTNNI
jgi:hypothetical protein